ncbi:MAG: DUF2442 domain-containing protein [Lamprobacter sp.]|uniref:DUF2442 domain-containing protein n=1 Tax=Lamprobacter sp. TaxID=3100796 RepID=UPI002B25F08A|nr:DUF2442 domain-containing protein [Lamprobacter sp.]MEA3643327.1 DUF2442 domain-containing protein [Lamprobacter sp.]
MKRPRLKAVQPLPPSRLRLTFVDDSVQEIDFAPLWSQSPGLAPLQQPDLFAEATLIEGEGWAVVWPSADIQIGADTLWLDAQAQNAPDDNTRIFAQWRARNRLSLAQAAEALGLTPRTISAFGTGARPVPRHIALACIGWEAEHKREAA